MSNPYLPEGCSQDAIDGFSGGNIPEDDYLSDDCCVECGAPADMDCDETCGRFMAVKRLLSPAEELEPRIVPESTAGFLE